MPANIEQLAIEKLRALSPEQQKEVLKFIESLKPATTHGKSLWADIREIVRDVPEQVWEQMPEDGSLNVDHYLYGAPKR